MINTNSIFKNNPERVSNWRDLLPSAKPSKHYINHTGYVYTLKLEGDNYYVGYTERPVMQRFEEHVKGIGAIWTKMHKPIEIISYVPGNMHDENEISWNLIQKYGIERVRGGKYCQRYYSETPKEVISSKERRLDKFPRLDLFREYDKGAKNKRVTKQPPRIRSREEIVEFIKSMNDDLNYYCYVFRELEKNNIKSFKYNGKVISYDELVLRYRNIESNFIKLCTDFGIDPEKEHDFNPENYNWDYGNDRKVEFTEQNRIHTNDGTESEKNRPTKFNRSFGKNQEIKTFGFILAEDTASLSSPILDEF